MTDEELARLGEQSSESDPDIATGGTWAGRVRRCLAALREERAARLKSEAERDANGDVARKAIETCARVIVERDEALALLSKVREAWAELLEARESYATEREAGEAAARDWIAWKHASDGYRDEFSERLEAAGVRVQDARADLSRLLGEAP